MKGVTVGETLGGIVTTISIHTPVKGVTNLTTGNYLAEVYISIHTPVKGVTGINTV